MEARRFYIITGGTVVHVTPHFSLAAPAYGQVGEQITLELQRELDCRRTPGSNKVVQVRTRMALGSRLPSFEEQELFASAGIKVLETNDDLKKLLAHLVERADTAGIILAAAICDWEPVALGEAPSSLLEEIQVLEELAIAHGGPDSHLETGSISLSGWVDNISTEFGKHMPRLRTRDGAKFVALRSSEKLLAGLRQTRKDIFLVGFKATTDMSEQAQYITGLELLKSSSCNLVFANDVHKHRNMVITPEEAKYHVTKDRQEAIRGLCEMIAMRSALHFTRSEVIEGVPIPWDSAEVPENLRKVVNHCIKRNAYKPFQGKTVGHFATRGPEPGSIYTSRRKSNFNELAKTGLLRIDAVGEDHVVAHGAKPSVGGQSQRIIFEEHPDVDCIVHAHVPLRSGRGSFPLREQRPFECGSHECGRNASAGLVDVWEGIKAVMLTEHGPNICFSKTADPDRVIEFIETFFDLNEKTGGSVSLVGAVERT